MPHPLAAGGVTVGGRLQVVRSLTRRGSRSVTFLANDAQSKQTVVLRELRDDLRATPEHQAAFKEDLKRVSELALPGLPPVRGVVPHEGRSYLITSYMQGHSLRAMLDKQPRVPVEQAIQLLTAVLNVLTGLHGRFPPLNHLEITPDNILLAGWDKPMLLGGSWIKALGNPFETGSASDAVYAAPELVFGQGTAASDLYSLGLCIAEAVTATPAKSLFNAHTGRAGWDPLPHAGLNEVLLRMCAPSLAERFATAAEALQALKDGPKARAPQPAAPQPAAPVSAMMTPMTAPPPQPVAPTPPPTPPIAPPPQPAFEKPRMTADALAQPAPVAPPPVAPPPAPVPPPPPPRPKAPLKPIENIDDVSTEEGLDALMALYEAQNT